MTPAISIVVPVFNQLDFTKQLLESISENLFFKESCEIVIVDNASTDGTEEFFKTKRSVKYVRNKENVYVTPAWNQGFHMSEGEFVIFMNNDLTLFKDFDLKLISAYQGKIVCPGTLQIGTSQPYRQRFNINGTCWMMRRSDWNEDLPNELKLWYSDDFAFHRYGVTWINEYVTHWGSQTLGKLPEANPVIAHDAEVWKWIMKERGWNDGRFPN